MYLADAATEVQASQWLVRGQIGRNIGTTSRASLGLTRGWGDTDVETGSILPRSQPFNSGYLSLTFDHDSLDSLFFPRSGSRAKLEWRHADEALGADSDFDQLEGSLNLAYKFHDVHSLFFGMRGGYSFDDDAPAQNLFQLGGFLMLSGYENKALTGRHYALARGGYLHRMNGGLVPTYLGFSLEAGNTWFTSDQAGFDDLVYGGSAFIGADTPIGPVYGGLGVNTDSNYALYLMLGSPWY